MYEYGNDSSNFPQDNSNIEILNYLINYFKKSNKAPDDTKEVFLK